MSEQLTDDDVESIFSAISIAESEVGDDWDSLKDKLYNLYPEVKKAHDERDRKIKENDMMQKKKREEITKKVFQKINIHQKILPQIKLTFQNNFDEIRDCFSDEICLSADLYRYYYQELKSAGLVEELREVQRKANDTYSLKQLDYDTWHTLSRVLEDMHCWVKRKKK